MDIDMLEHPALKAQWSREQYISRALSIPMKVNFLNLQRYGAVTVEVRLKHASCCLMCGFSGCLVRREIFCLLGWWWNLFRVAKPLKYHHGNAVKHCIVISVNRPAQRRCMSWKCIHWSQISNIVLNVTVAMDYRTCTGWECWAPFVRYVK